MSLYCVIILLSLIIQLPLIFYIHTHCFIFVPGGTNLQMDTESPYATIGLLPLSS
jgi:hypothetical protein